MAKTSLYWPAGMIVESSHKFVHPPLSTRKTGTTTRYYRLTAPQLMTGHFVGRGGLTRYFRAWQKSDKAKGLADPMKVEDETPKSSHHSSNPGSKKILKPLKKLSGPPKDLQQGQDESNQKQRKDPPRSVNLNVNLSKSKPKRELQPKMPSKWGAQPLCCKLVQHSYGIY